MPRSRHRFVRIGLATGEEPKLRTREVVHQGRLLATRFPHHNQSALCLRVALLKTVGSHISVRVISNGAYTAPETASAVVQNLNLPLLSCSASYSSVPKKSLVYIVCSSALISS